MGGDALRLGLANGGQGAEPAAPGGDFAVQIAQGQHAGRDQLLGRDVVKPARHHVGSQRLLGSQVLDGPDQCQLAFTQVLASLGPGIRRVRLGVHLGHVRLAPAVQIPLRDEVFQRRLAGVQPQGNGQPDQAPGALPAPPRNRPNRLHRLQMCAARLVAVADAQVAPGAVGDVQTLGHGAQVGKVVCTEPTHVACRRVVNA